MAGDQAATRPGTTAAATVSADASADRGPLRVAVFGGAGRLGSVLVQAIRAAEDLTVVAELGRDTPRSLLAASGAQVALDVTGPTAVAANVAACLAAGIDVVVGTSGLTAADLDRITQLLQGSGDATAPGTARTGVLVAPNFSIAAVLAEALAVRAARFLPSVEIVEAHHDRKVDAPSGTARRTAQRIAAARAAAGFGAVPDATAHDPDGARGALVDGVRVHAVRLPGFVASQAVVFGGTGETLTIRHDSTSRESFVPGALLALRRVGSLPGLTVGLEALLGLDHPHDPDLADTAADGTAVRDTAVDDTAVPDTAVRDTAVRATAVRDTARGGG